VNALVAAASGAFVALAATARSDPSAGVALAAVSHPDRGASLRSVPKTRSKIENVAL
jgi:hypothetical protein